MKLTANHTVAACFTGLTVQSIVINLPPLLFLTFENEFKISLSKISLLIAISFITQLLMDFTASKMPILFSKRSTMVIGQVFCVCGLCGMALLPSVMPPYVALIISTAVASFGSGIIEVMGNPIIEATPVKNKNRILSLMHSFYCWGLVLTVLLSTLFFKLVGIEHWRILFCLWAIIPAINTVAFIFVPFPSMESAPIVTSKKESVFRTLTFWVFFLLMLCAGAAEMTMAQWASSFAEMGLKVSKSTGDLLGPCAFAVLMGIARVIYAKFSARVNLSKLMIASSALCVISYLVTAFSPLPILSLIGCAVCGFSVGIMWPGTLCMATEKIPNGGVKMFALLALAGDAGCTVGPTAAGWIAETFGNNLKISFVFSTVFPAIMIALIAALIINQRKNEKNANLTK